MRFLALVALALTAALAQAEEPHRFSFAIVGDAPYSAREESLFAQMLEEINQENLAFVVHIGDIKSGATPCSDELFVARKQLFDRSRYPFILVPGDNEWTDCWRPAAGGYDPLERLAKLRLVFYPDARSLGGATLRLERQSDDVDTAPRFRAYRENVRWTAGGVLFVGLNLPGSNNNFRRDPRMDTEFRERSDANAAWLAQSFDLAQRKGYRAAFVFVQANPRFDRSYLRRENPTDGYADFKKDLLAHTQAFGRPVILVHGDTHHFRVDKPLIDPATLQRVEQFTRIESFGSPFVDWVKVNIDPSNPQVFSYRTGRNPLPPGLSY